ncbi:MmgE/PrpD family protein [Chloroflexota bacterium]
MTFQRDLGYQSIELMYKSSISYQFARYGLRLNYEMLPQDIVHQAKRCLLDALGCAIGAYEAPGRPMCENVAKMLGGPEEATVIGSGLRTSAPNASFVNGFMVRFLDFNDRGGGGHNNESIPAILAIGEREKTGGSDFLTSVVISYELGARVRESFIGTIFGHGFDFDLRAGLSMPPVLGRLMGLNEDQIANAIGICASTHIPLNILDGDKEEFTMSKNTRFAWVARGAIIACMLAKQGFTGPVRVVEGDCGWRASILKGDMDLERMVNFSGWRIMKTSFKYLAASGVNHAHIHATIDIVKEHDLKPEDIAAVKIKLSKHGAEHTTTFTKKYPRNAESADHSAFFLTAIAIKDRAITPDSVKPENFTDPVVLDLIEKTTVEADPNFILRTNGSHVAWQGAAEIITKDGRKFQKQVDVPHGFGNDNLTDKELEQKFNDMAIKHMPEKQIKQIFDTVWNAEKLDDMGKLMKLMVFPSR